MVGRPATAGRKWLKPGTEPAVVADVPPARGRLACARARTDHEQPMTFANSSPPTAPRLESINGTGERRATQPPRAAQDARDESEAAARLSASDALCASAEFELDGTLLGANENWLAALGYRSTEL